MSNSIIQGLGYAHIAVASYDFEKSLAFYKALGMTVYTEWGEGDKHIALLDMGNGNLLELFCKPTLNSEKSAGLEDGAQFMHFAFSVEDVDAAYQTALAAGATPLTDPKDAPLQSHPVPLTLRVAFVKGPCGEELEFFKATVREE